MLPVNAIQFIMGSPQFINVMNQNGVDPNYCLGIKMRRIRDEIGGYSYYEVYFDYGNPDLSAKDVVATVKIINNNRFQLVQLRPV
jgi:hypothetical protein